MDDNLNNFDDDFSFDLSFDVDAFLDELFSSPIIGFPNDNQQLSNEFFNSSEVASSSGNVNIDEKLIDCLEELPPQSLTIEEPKQVEQIASMKIDTNGIRGNNDQLYNEYNPNSLIHTLNVPLSPHPQQSLTQHIYDDDARFLPPMSSTTVTRYPNMYADIGCLYQGGVSFSTCNGVQGQGLFPGGIMSMPISTSMTMSMPMSTSMSTSIPMTMSMPRLMPTTMPMPTPMPMLRSMPTSMPPMPTLMSMPIPVSRSMLTLMPLPEMDYQEMSMRQNNLHDSFQQHGYGSINVQMLGDKQQQQQQEQEQQQQQQQQQQQLHNNSLVVDESTFKIGCISPEEKKEKINRFLEKRKHRNFKKKIKYTCRKTLADSRPRVRGRFAKNCDL